MAGGALPARRHQAPLGSWGRSATARPGPVGSWWTAPDQPRRVVSRGGLRPGGGAPAILRPPPARTSHRHRDGAARPLLHHGRGALEVCRALAASLAHLVALSRRQREAVRLPAAIRGDRSVSGGLHGGHGHRDALAGPPRGDPPPPPPPAPAARAPAPPFSRRRPSTKPSK